MSDSETAALQMAQPVRRPNPEQPESREGSISLSQDVPLPVIPKRESPHVRRQSSSAFLHDISRSVICTRVSTCYVRTEFRGPLRSPVHQLFNDEESPLLVAHTKSNVISTRFRIIAPFSGEQIGWISSDWKSLNYTVSGLKNFTVSYSENVCGRNGSRNFSVVFDQEEIFVVKPLIMIDGGSFQDFHDMEAVQSIKNFVLLAKNDFSREVVMFAKLSETLYELRVTFPFSLLSAFALVLTDLHTGFFHR
jgi:hypothetical protein